jgi:NCAIR mutase (PurE)-related protein
MRKVAWGIGIVLGLFFLVRAIVELVVIDFSDPATYRDDWGGPSLVGVLLVHCGPGLLVVALGAVYMAAVRNACATRTKPPDRGK